MNQKARDTAKRLARHYFKNDYGEPFELTNGQSDIFLTIFTKRYPRNQIIASTQYGKLLADDTPTLTSKGWKKHGDLEVGDKVYNHLGKQVEVLHIHPKGYADRQVVTSNNEKILAHHRHEWVTENRKKDIRIKETDEAVGCVLPNIQALEFNKQKVAIDPYILGLWLGDGTSSKPTFTFGKEDAWLVNEIPFEMSSMSIHNQTGVPTFNFYKTKLHEQLKKLNLINNKHVPDSYIYNSVEVRLQLLAGLIDTDGYVQDQYRSNGHRSGRVYFTNTDKKIIDSVVLILSSLGMRPCVVTTKATLSSSGIQGRKNVYIVGFEASMTIPTRIQRKRVIPKRIRRLKIKSVSKIKPVQGNCITVEGGIYLVGRKLIPTHNSDTIAMALLLRSVTFKEPWAIISGQKDKAQIIMDRVIQHAFDHEFFFKKLEVDPNFSLDRLRRERSKDRINWLGGGGIRTFTANSKNKQAVKEALTGFGSPNIVADESSLIPDEVNAMMLRMLGGHKDNFLLKIGNPFYRNHFMKTSQSSKYHNILIDYKQGIEEGRYTQDFIEEMRDQPFFDILYECVFPEQNKITPEGYRQLISDKLLQDSYITEEQAKDMFHGELKLGADFAGSGNDKSAYVLRSDKCMRILQTNDIKDTMQQIPIVEDYIEEFNLHESNVALDYGGLGQGIGDRLIEKGYEVNNVMFGQSSPETDKYINMRAYMYYQLFLWLKNGGKIIIDDRWIELTTINYKEDSERRLKIQAKEDLKKLAKKMGINIGSPDIADAAALTFADNLEMITEEDFDIL
jgi:hypothetical protein